MNTLNIILLSMISGLVVTMIILVIFIIKDNIGKKNSQIDNIRFMRQRIKMLIDRHIEDENLDKYIEQFPDIKSEVEAYRKARDEYYDM